MLVDNMVILVDKQEKRNEHVVEYFDKKKIPYKKMKLDQGDYSFYIKSTADTKKIGISKDLWFDDKVVIERKASLEELSGNLTDSVDGRSERKRLENEFIRLRNVKTYLMIENGVFRDLILHRYETNYDPEAFLGSINAFQNRYDFSIECIGPNFHETFWIMQQLIEKGLIQSENWATVFDTVRTLNKERNNKCVGYYIHRKLRTFLKDYFKVMDDESQLYE